MKAIIQRRYGTPDGLELGDVESPEIGDREVLLRVHAAGVDPGVWHLMTGRPYLVRLAGYGLRRPKRAVLGSDVAGRIEAVGKDVTRFGVGDEVYGMSNGAFAEHASAHEDKLAPKPGELTFEQAAAVPTSGTTALQGLRDIGDIRAGQTVLIIGAAGGVGSFAVQIAKALGAHVTGVCSTTKTSLVESIGADEVIDYTADDFTQRRELYDIILDTAGNRSVSSLRRVLTPRGTLVIVGGENGGRWVGGTDRQLRALALSPFVRQRLRTFIAKERGEDLRFLSELIDAHKVTPVIDRSFQLPEVSDAIRYFAAGHSRGKVVITV